MRAASGCAARSLAVDGAAVLAISITICAGSDQLLFMSVFVPAVVVARFVAWARLQPARPRRLGAEAVFFSLCTLTGGLNDWRSVVGHGIYDYDVPVYFPELTTIPLWKRKWIWADCRRKSRRSWRK